MPLLPTLTRPFRKEPVDREALIAEALDFAARVSDPVEKANQLVLLAAKGGLSAEQRDHAIAEVSRLAGSMDDPKESGKLYFAIASLTAPAPTAPTYAAGIRDEALATARAMTTHPAAKANALQLIAGYFPDDHRETLYAEAMEAARAVEDEEMRVRAMTNILKSAARP